MTINKNKTPFDGSNLNASDIDDQQNNSLNTGSATEIISSLKNHLLIAMPSLTDPYFKQSVVYLCEHDEQGAMGFIINYPVQLSLQELLNNIDNLTYQPDPPLTQSVFLGGPLDMERGFVIHTPTTDNSKSTPLNEELMMSNSSEVLSSLGTDRAPDQFMVALGYASWDTGQLEEEMNQNQWLTIDSENELIFNTPVEERWTLSLKRLGIDPSHLSSEVGHA